MDTDEHGLKAERDLAVGQEGRKIELTEGNEGNKEDDGIEKASRTF
jgi:hypothetical protein